MANTFITPTVIAKRALATLYNNAVLAGLVHRDYDSEFNGAVGDTISVRKPATFEGKTFVRGTGIEIQNATEDKFDVTLDTVIDVSFAVTSEDMSLEIADFSTQLLNPAVEAINQRIDGDLAELLVDTAEGSGGGGTATWNGTQARTVFTGQTGAVAKLLGAKAPTLNRSAVFGAAGTGVALSDDLFVKANESGSTDGLREASIGRLFGFDTYASQVFGYGPNDKGQADGVAFHKDAVALVARTLPKPDGIAAEQVAIAAGKGYGLRVVKSYDITKKQDVVSVDILVGYEKVRPEMAVQLSFGIGS